MAGKLVVLEGTDGSGKSTQMQLLCERFRSEGRPFRKLTFPRYQEPSSWMVRMYLKGLFGKNPSDINAYAASTFYAVDRFASYAVEWKDAYRAGGFFLADRYATSNAVHQTSKLPEEEWALFFDWLADFEYVKLELPRPDLVLFLDMPVSQSLTLLRQREKETGTRADIHEGNQRYLAACHKSGLAAAEYYGWRKISCVEGEKVREAGAIHEEIYRLISAELGD
ncbi:MAG: deoxynucleoside kinase [Oscillospiraceae bacterium]|nr:deoxynucleoside kinase [Oscillospiraceae bacterium]